MHQPILKLLSALAVMTVTTAWAQDEFGVEEDTGSIDITGEWHCQGEAELADEITIKSIGTHVIRRREEGGYFSTGSSTATTWLTDGRNETSVGSSRSQGVLRGRKYYSTPVEMYSSQREFTMDKYDGVVSVWHVSSERMDLQTVSGNPELLRVVGTCLREPYPSD